jgi:hypothetical protein
MLTSGSVHRCLVGVWQGRCRMLYVGITVFVEANGQVLKTLPEQSF